MRQLYLVLLTCAVFLFLPSSMRAQFGASKDSTAAAHELLTLKATDGRSHEIEAIALGRSGNTDVVYFVERVSDVVSREVLNPDGEYLLWKLDTTGKLLHKEFLTKMPNPGPPRVTIVPLAPPLDGAIVIGVFEDRFGWSLLRVDGAGKLVKSVKLINEPGAFVTALLLPDAKGLLLAGQYGLKGNVWKVDLDGKAIWKKTYNPIAKPDDKTAKTDDKSSAKLYSITLTDDQGGFIAAGDFGPINKLGLGQRSVWLMRCDAAGAVLSETTFPGRLPLICSVGKENFAVLYGVRPGMTIESRVRIVDSQLKQQWEKRAEFTSVWVDPPAISPIPSHQAFVLAGCNVIVDKEKKSAKRECRLFQYDANGEIASSTSIPLTQKAFLRTRVVCEPHRAYVAAQTKGFGYMEIQEASIFVISLQKQRE